MFGNFLLIAFRNNLDRSKAYALISFLSLVSGIVCALALFKVISYELSFNRLHGNSEDTHSVVRNDIFPVKLA